MRDLGKFGRFLKLWMLFGALCGPSCKFQWHLKFCAVGFLEFFLILVFCNWWLLVAAFGCFCHSFCVLFLLGSSKASEQSERAKLSGAFSGFPLLPHAFAGVPLLCFAFSCFASLRVVWHFLLNGTLAFPHSCSILFLVAPCLVLFSLVLPCANIS